MIGPFSLLIWTVLTSETEASNRVRAAYPEVEQDPVESERPEETPRQSPEEAGLVLRRRQLPVPFSVPDKQSRKTRVIDN